MAYKAINTLDSMVGYRNDTYRNFGWASAKLDDIANYIPARITGILIVGATYIIHASRHGVHEGSKRLKTVQNRPGVFIAKLFSRLEQRTEKANFEESLRAFEIMRRDGRKHSSPNSGIPEAAMAGALGVQLGGPSTYKGRTIKKPYIGKEFQHREAGAEYTDGFYLRASKKAISITKIVSLSGLLIAILICYMKAAL
jgi:adenosylcobinamide-phosphate synthase